MDRFDLEASYKRTKAAIDTLIDMEAKNPIGDPNTENRFGKLKEAYRRIEEAEELISS